MSDFSDWFTKQLTDRDWTDESFATASGGEVSKSTAGAWRKGTSRPEPENWNPIIRVLGVGLSELAAMFGVREPKGRAQPTRGKPADPEETLLLDAFRAHPDLRAGFLSLARGATSGIPAAAATGTSTRSTRGRREGRSRS